MDRETLIDEMLEDLGLGTIYEVPGWVLEGIVETLLDKGWTKAEQ